MKKFLSAIGLSLSILSVPVSAKTVVVTEDINIQVVVFTGTFQKSEPYISALFQASSVHGGFERFVLRVKESDCKKNVISVESRWVGETEWKPFVKSNATKPSTNGDMYGVVLCLLEKYRNTAINNSKYL